MSQTPVSTCKCGTQLSEINLDTTWEGRPEPKPIGYICSNCSTKYYEWRRRGRIFRVEAHSYEILRDLTSQAGPMGAFDAMFSLRNP